MPTLRDKGEYQDEDYEYTRKYRDWSAEEQYKRTRKALRDGVIACILIALAWALLLMFFMPKAEGQELTPVALGASRSVDSPAKPLPSAPAPKVEAGPISRPKPIALGRFWDKPNRITAVVMISLAGADAAQTCRNLAKGGHEVVLMQSCALDTAIVAGADSVAILGAWTLHKWGHHRLERVPMIFMGYESAYGLIYSKRSGAW